MNVNAAGGSSAAGMVGAGIRMLSAANQAQLDMAKKMLPMQVAENAGRAASEARGLFVDTYA
ncbi:MAG: hypothetical protein LBV15_06065 [Planctomycetota bacterium]|jgi:hypothetical protein|nr:hypothetical protein [Planctomycetota bacterium]